MNWDSIIMEREWRPLVSLVAIPEITRVTINGKEQPEKNHLYGIVIRITNINELSNDAKYTTNKII